MLNPVKVFDFKLGLIYKGNFNKTIIFGMWKKSIHHGVLLHHAKKVKQNKTNVHDSLCRDYEACLMAICYTELLFLLLLIFSSVFFFFLLLNFIKWFIFVINHINKKHSQILLTFSC